MKTVNKNKIARIILLYYEHKKNKNNLAPAIVFLGMVFLNNFHSITGVWLVLGLLMYGLLQLDTFLLRYRIKKGYFGNNKYETMEIVPFIFVSV